MRYNLIPNFSPRLIHLPYSAAFCPPLEVMGSCHAYWSLYCRSEKIIGTSGRPSGLTYVLP